MELDSNDQVESPRLSNQLPVTHNHTGIAPGKEPDSKDKEYEILVDTYIDIIKGKYEESKHLSLSKRAMPENLQYNKDNKVKIEACNEVFINVLAITPGLKKSKNFNSCYHATAYIVAGSIKIAINVISMNTIKMSQSDSTN